MSIFIDTGIFIAYINKKDSHNKEATALMEGIMKNYYGAAFTSDFIFDEAVTFVLYKTGKIELAQKVKDLILGSQREGIPAFINLVFVDEESIAVSWNLFKRYNKKRLSFTDSSSIALMDKYGINQIASFDGDFDGIVARIPA